MDIMIVRRPRIHVDHGWATASAVVSVAGRPHELFYRVSRGPLAASSDALLVAGLLPAMRIGASLRVEGCVSASLLRHLSTVQDIICTWYPQFTRIPVEATVAPTAASLPGRGVGCFFSGGIDSSYSVLKNQAELTHLIFIHGFDIPLDNRALDETVSPAVREAAAGHGKPLIEVETNLKGFLDAYIHWGEESHGAALASIALLLSPVLRKVFIASTHTYRHLHPHGSHPLLDPLWSSDETEIVHDGCEATRWDKLLYISGNETVRRHLRSCYRNTDGAYNCGRCRTCLRSMAFVHAMGMDGQFTTFSRPLDLVELAHMPMPEPENLVLTEDLVRFLDDHSGAPDVIQALREALAAAGASGQEHVQSLEAKLRRCETRRIQCETRLLAQTSSLSWRVTAPLRAAARIGRRLRHRAGG